jgi:hypothetical protein
MAKKPDNIDRLRTLSCWLELLLFVLAFLLPVSWFQQFALYAIAVIAILQFTSFRHF